MTVVALLLLAALPLAAGTLPGTRSWRVTLAPHAGPDSAATAKRLAAMYRGELETPVDAQGAFLIALTDAAAAVLEADPAVQSLQPEGAEAVPSAPPRVATVIRTPPVVANAAASWSLGTYSYDGSGNIEKIGLDPYVYDLQNRLVSGVAGGKTEQYTYDEFGNILTIETTGSAKQYLGVDPATNRMSQTTGTVGGQTVTYDKTAGYDAAGNVTSHLLDQFQYDGLNVLTKAYVASKWRSYVYNASDERIGVIERSSATGAETRSDWTLRDASGQVLRRLSREGGQWQWNEDYIYRGSQMLAAEVAGPAKRYQYHLDHLGTPRLITGNGGVELSRHTYLPFGTEVGAIAGQNPADGEWKKFTGHERDHGSIDYMHARYYNPFVGRFLSVDPTWESADLGRSQSWNRYSYVENSPINKVDPDGKVGVLAILAVLDKGADALGLAYDIYTIAREGPNEANVKQLAVDVGLTVAPVPGNVGAAKAIGGALGAAAGFIGFGYKTAKVADGTVVIGKMADLNKAGALKTGERMLDLPDKGSIRANWKQNSSRLREAMASRKPIRDASVDANGKLRDNTGFLGAERNLLRSKGWTYNETTRLWNAPK